MARYRLHLVGDVFDAARMTERVAERETFDGGPAFDGPRSGLGRDLARVMFAPEGAPGVVYERIGWDEGRHHPGRVVRHDLVADVRVFDVDALAAYAAERFTEHAEGTPWEDDGPSGLAGWLYEALHASAPSRLHCPSFGISTETDDAWIERIDCVTDVPVAARGDLAAAMATPRAIAR